MRADACGDCERAERAAVRRRAEYRRCGGREQVARLDLESRAR